MNTFTLSALRLVMELKKICTDTTSGRALLSALPGLRTPMLQRGMVGSTLSSFSE